MSSLIQVANGFLIGCGLVLAAVVMKLLFHVTAC